MDKVLDELKSLKTVRDSELPEEEKMQYVINFVNNVDGLIKEVEAFKSKVGRRKGK
jgi:hypothetical protein